MACAIGRAKPKPHEQYNPNKQSHHPSFWMLAAAHARAGRSAYHMSCAEGVMSLHMWGGGHASGGSLVASEVDPRR